MKQFYRKHRNSNFNSVTYSNLSYLTNSWNITDVNGKCTIQSFGVTETSASVYTEFTGFFPFFYIQLVGEKRLPNIKTFLYKFPEYIINQSEFIQENCQAEFKKNFYGYQESDQVFVKLTFKSYKAYTNLIKYFYKKNYFGGYSIQLFESKSVKLLKTDVSPVLRFLHKYNILSCGKITLKNVQDISSLVNTTCNINARCHISNIVSSENYEKSIPLIIASFDIESFSDNNTFPNADFPKDVITHISTTFKINGSSDILCQYTVSLKSNPFQCNENQFHTCVSSEKELILAFQKSIINMDPDIICSYNGDMFDWQYLYKRAKKCNLPLQIGKIRDIKCELVNDGFQSSARGNSTFKRLNCKGRFLLDVLTYVQMEFKEESYKLDSIATKYLGHTKNEMTVKQMFQSYRESDFESAKEVGRYCQKDAILPLQLVDKLHILQVLIGMANVCWLPIELLIFSGQQDKAYSQILRETSLRNYCIPSFTPRNEDKFVGATVFEPKVGIYLTPVTVVDFKSLYPSIMRAHNLCFSTFKTQDKSHNTRISENEKDVETFEWDDTSGHHCYSFVKKEKLSGVIPDLLKVLGDSREASKKLRSQFKKSDFEYIVYDKLQNAYKLSMNSIYGFLTSYFMPCMPIGATVTRVGRVMLEKTANYITKQYGDTCQVIYGDTDSVFYNNKKGSMKDAILLGNKIADEVSKLFVDPIELEFEKVYDPLILQKKKRYCGALYTKVSKTYDYIDYKGIQSQRRDSCILLRNMYKKILGFIIDKHPELCLDYIKEQMTKLRAGQIPVEELILSRTLAASYKNTNLPHVVVANLRRERGETVNSNERVEYLFKKTGTFREPQYRKVDDPKYIIENNIPIDYNYYIVSQIEKPLTELIEVMFDPKEIEACFFKQDISDIVETEKEVRKETRKSTRIQEKAKVKQKSLKDFGFK